MRCLKRRHGRAKELMRCQVGSARMPLAILNGTWRKDQASDLDRHSTLARSGYSQGRTQDSRFEMAPAGSQAVNGRDVGTLRQRRSSVVDSSCEQLPSTKALRSCLSCGNFMKMDVSRVKKTVSFHQIEVREYPRALGDNPSVSSGPALALDWYNEDTGRTYAVPLRDDGAEKDSRARQVPRSTREDILREGAGVSRSAMLDAQREAIKIKKSRQKNARGRVWSMPNLLKLNKKEDKELRRLMLQSQLADQRRRHSDTNQAPFSSNGQTSTAPNHPSESPTAATEVDDGEVWEF